MSLPQSLLELADIIGFEAMAKLASSRGGQDVEIPMELNENYLLCQIIGLEATKKMIDYYGYGRLYIAQGDFRGEKGRRRLGMHLRSQGYSNAEVARICDVAIRTVKSWNKKAPQKEQELPLLELMNNKK